MVGLLLDSMIFRVFSNLNNSMILYVPDNASTRGMVKQVGYLLKVEEA